MTTGHAPFPLSEFVEKHELPCTVMVTTGYSCGDDDEDDSISQGEIITLHSVQHDQIIHATDPLGREQTLPVIGNRKYQYLTSNPDHDNVMYETVQDLISDTGRPDKVRVTASVDSGDDESTIYADDILEIVKVEAKPSPRTGSINPMLIAKNSFGESLRLPTDTPGKFSPILDVKWYSMVEIITKADFPVRVSLVRTRPGSTKYQHMEKFTIVSTSLSRNVLVTVNKELMVMPIDVQLEVMLKEDDEQPQSPFLLGRHVSDDAAVDSDDNLPPPPDADSLAMAGEAELALEQPAEKRVKPPPVAKKPSLAIRQKKVVLPVEKRKSLLTDIETVRLRMGSVRTFGTSRRSSSVMSDDVLVASNPDPEQIREVFRSLTENTAKVHQLEEESNKQQARCNRLNTHYHAVKKQLTQLERAEEFWRAVATDGKEVDADLQRRCEQYKPTMEDAAALDVIPVSQPPAQQSTVSPPMSNGSSDNELTWSTLSQAHMQQVLSALNMNQYKELFAREQVDGGLLLELDEDAYEHDLGVKSALHRKKLLRTITGKGLPLVELIQA